ncbi:Ig-like domain-containing protein [Flavobacterium sp.]|uniref:Ig-like domain-containing protein n=2 Tax=Flavobacterium sp. TaxID=239 RepID=UPI00403464FE
MRKFTSAIAYRAVGNGRVAWLSMCVLFLFCVQMAKAQVATLYTFSQSNGTYTEISGGTVLGAVGSDDQVFNNNTTGETGSITNTGFPIGFSFVYDGVAYDKFAVNYNGWIKLGTGSFAIESTSTPLSSGTASISNVISGAGTDMQGQAGSELSYALVGSAPNRKLVVQWKNVKRYTTGAQTSSINYQIVLNETSNVVEVVYGSMATSSTAATAWVAEVGIKGPNNTFATNINNRTTTTDWNASVSGTSNSSKMSFNTTVTFPVPGLTFKWSPPAACTATPVAGTTSTTLIRSVCSGTAPGVITVAGATSLSIPGIAYQWQESLNGGTDWASVTSGTGATTASYTPPVFAGASIQYRLKVTCANGGDAVYSEVTTINPVAAPSTQATAITVTAANTSINAFSASWTVGNGGRRMVVVSTTPITDPVNVTGQPALTAAAAYAGTGQQIVYDGTGTSVTITGLACGTQYYVKVFDYNRCGPGPYDYYYNTTTGTNGITVTTLSPATLPLAVINNFTGYTGANLSTAVPGWYEASIPTVAGTNPSSTNPVNGLDTSTGWRQSTAFGITTAKVNLFDNTTNAWIISPKMAITANSRLKFKAAIAEYANAGTTTADVHRMQGTDDKVMVLVSTDGCGANWTPLYTFDAASTTTLTNQLTEYTVLLNAYIGQTIQIAFQATDGPVNQADQDYDFHIGNLIIEAIPACETPVLAATTGVTKNSATINWAAPAQSSPTGYQYVVSTTNTAPAGAGTPAAGLTANISSLTSSTTYYVFVRSVCGSDFSNWTPSGTFTTLCDYPDITATTGGSVCGQGTVALSATAPAGAQYIWYNAATGGSVIATGNAFTTPLISATTNYYVSSASSTLNTDVAVGAGATTTDTYSNPFYSLWSNNHTQHLITAAELYAAGIGAGAINSIALDVTSAGTLPMIDLAIKVGASNATSMTAFTSNSGFATVYTSPSYLPTVGINTFTFTTPFVWDGISNIVVEFCHGNGSSSATMSRTVAADVTSYVSTVKFHTSSATAASVACGATSGGNLTSYSLRPKFIFNGNKLCLSPRQAVAATVTTPPALTLSAATASICNGQSSTVTVTAGAADYDTYVWAPATGVTGNQTTGWTFNPTATTTYTLTATQSAGSMCSVSKTFTVTVNALPSAITLSPAASTICTDAVQALTATGGTVSGNASIGTGTTAPSSTEHPNPFNAWYGGHWTQMLYKKAELEAQGMIAGVAISSIAFDFANSSDKTLNDLTIRIGSSSNENMTGGFVPFTSLSTVYNANYTPVAGTTGFVTFNFTTPFVWDGVSNIVVEVVHNSGNGGNGAGTTIKTTTTTFDSAYYLVKDSTTPPGVASLQALDLTTVTTKGVRTARPNARFAFNLSNTVTWSPAANLYTDATAATPYVAGTNANTVYVKSAATVATTTYTATVTNTAGCTRTATADVTVLNCGIDWANLQHPATGTINTCGTHTVYAQVYKDGVTQAAGQGANITAWIGVSANAGDPSTWPETAWHLATFNVQSDNNDEYMYTISGLPAGTYYYASRFKFLTGSFYYGGFSGGEWNGTSNVSGVLTVNAVAAPTADATQTFCNAATVANLSATGTGVKWYAAATGGTALDAATALTNGGVYHASQTIDGCESTARVQVTVTLTTPAAPTATATQTLCNAGTVADLMATGTAGATISWYDEATGGTALAATVALTNGGTYYASQTITGCESVARTLVTITINAPAAPTAAASQTFCDAATIADLTATGTAGAAISWYGDATGGTALATTTALTNGGIYYAAQTVTGCESAVRTMVTVTISTVATPVATVSQPTCAVATGTIVVTAPVGVDYTYSIDGTAFQVGATFSALAPGTYTVTAKNANDCVATTTVTVNAAPEVPVAPVTVLVQPTCAVATGTITVSTPIADAYTYSIDGTTFGPSSIFENVAPGTYTVSVKNADGCTATATVVINDAPAVPDAPQGAETQTFTVDNVADATIEDIVVTLGAGGTITWYPTAIDAENGTGAIAAGTQLVSGNTYYGVQTIGECSGIDYIAVTVDVVLGKEDFNHTAFRVYPNPVKDVLTISYTSEITSVAVFNLLGQQVLSKQPNANEVKVDLSSLAEATYIVNVTVGDTVKTIKVVKKQ